MGRIKETLIKTYVICENITQEKSARSFYKSFGFELDMPEMVNLKNHFPCVIGTLNHNANRCIKTLMTSMIREDERWTEIKLESKPRRKFPREMMVSNRKDIWYQRMVVGKAKTQTPFIAIKNPYLIDDQFPEYAGWRYAKEID